MLGDSAVLREGGELKDQIVLSNRECLETEEGSGTGEYSFSGSSRRQGT